MTSSLWAFSLILCPSLSALTRTGGIFFRVGGVWTALFMLALVSRVRNCPEGAHSSAGARLKVCEPSGQSPEPQWPYTGPVAEIRLASGRGSGTAGPVRLRAEGLPSNNSITLGASLLECVSFAFLLKEGWVNRAHF